PRVVGDLEEGLHQGIVTGRDRTRVGRQHDGPRFGEPALGGAQVVGPARRVEGEAPRREDLVLSHFALLAVLRRLRRALERHLRRLVAAALAENSAPQPQGLRVRLQSERAVERQQRATGVADAIRGVPELVPGEGKVGIALQRLLQRGERFAIASQLDQRGALEADTMLRELVEFLRIPSVSTLPAHDADCRRAAEWVAAELRRLGCREVAFLASDVHPVVWGVGPDVPGAPTLLIYGHYDVQPPDPLGEWVTPPFEPTVRDGKLFARGSADDKGQVFCLLRAIA